MFKSSIYSILLLLGLSIFLFQCSEKTYPLASTSSKEVRLFRASVQKEIPGQQDAKIKTYLSITFQMDKAIELKELLFRGKVYTLDKRKTGVRIDLDNSVRKGENSKITNSDALVTYLKNGREKKVVLKEIKQLEDIYLP